MLIVTYASNKRDRNFARSLLCKPAERRFSLIPVGGLFYTTKVEMLNLRRSPSLCTASATGDMTEHFPSASTISETATSDLENTSISSLPAEILTEIFRAACESYEYTKTDVIVPTAVTLSSVCLLWRDIAINNPVFWSVLSVNLLRVSQKALQANSMLTLYLSRSKDIPLKYIVYSPDVEIEKTGAFFRFVITLTTIGKTRCFYAKIRIKQRELAETFIDRVLSSFRKLATIDVMPHWLALTPSSMSLDHLTIANATTGDLVALVVIVPSFIITSISFKNCDFVHNMLVLSKSCPHLHALTIQDPKYPKLFVRTLSQLTSLTIILNNNFLDSLTAILLSLDAPNLVSLTIDVGQWTRITPAVFSRFFRRSTRLESLVLKNCICLTSIKTALFSQERLGYLDMQVVLGDLDAVMDAIEARLCTSRPCNAVVLRLVQMDAPSVEVEGTEENSVIETDPETDPEDEKSYCFGCGGVHGDVEESDSEDDSESDEESDSYSSVQGSEKVEWRKRRLADIWPRAAPVPVCPGMLETVNVRYGARLGKFRAAGMRIAIVSG